MGVSEVPPSGSESVKMRWRAPEVIAATKTNLRPASMTGVPVMPSGSMLPQGSSNREAGAASVRDQIREPVNGSSAITSLFWVAMSSRSCPPSPPSQYNGWA